MVQAHQVGTAPWLDSPPHVSCPAPLRAELDRLLAGVSAHASRSSGCFDGPGERTTVTLLAVQSSRGKGVRWVRIRYGAVKEDAGGMRGCANGGCKPPEPSWGIAEISIRFSPAAGGYVMTVPGKWPVVDFDLQPMTPLDQEHDGKCYGKTPPFSPAVVKGW